MATSDVKDWFATPWEINNHVIYYNSDAFGILNPSVVFGIDETNNKYVIGPKGHVKVFNDEPDELIASLKATGSILWGDYSEIEEVSKYLSVKSLSRTISYFCCTTESCGDVISYVKRIKDTKVTMLGCGGIGSLTSLILAGTGLGKIKLVEHDIVEESNLNRQLFFTLDDVGQFKADVLAKRIKERFLNIDVEVVKDKITEENLALLMQETDVVVLTADEPIGMSKFAQRIANNNNIFFICSGYAARNSKVFTNLDEDEREDKKPIQWYRGPNSIMPSSGPVNAELAGVVSSIILHHMCGLIAEQSLPLKMMWDNSLFPRMLHHEIY